ncbi:hypothetical protein K469DRAFT_587955, partial [Zopfia rhizophila CBS 207.26]
TWKQQGRDADAINLMRECVRFGQRILGVDHLRSIASSTVLVKWEAEQVTFCDENASAQISSLM